MGLVKEYLIEQEMCSSEDEEENQE